MAESYWLHMALRIYSHSEREFWTYLKTLEPKITFSYTKSKLEILNINS